MEIKQLITSGENAIGLIPAVWETACKVPGGKKLFSKAVGRMAPYTGSIGATVVELAPGSSTVVLEDRPAVRNHLKCVHAIALANLGELTANLALIMSMPPATRFIISGLRIEYPKKARGTITATGSCPAITSSERAEYKAIATMRDASGDIVTRCVADVLVGPVR